MFYAQGLIKRGKIWGGGTMRNEIEMDGLKKSKKNDRVGMGEAVIWHVVKEDGRGGGKEGGKGWVRWEDGGGGPICQGIQIVSDC